MGLCTMSEIAQQIELQRLRELLDREAIRETIARYFTGHDRGDLDWVNSAFTANARLFIDGIQVRGSGTLPASERPQPRGVPMDKLLATSHVMGQCEIHVNGESARSETYAVAYLVLDSGEGRRRMLVRGLRYLDILRREGERWLIEERRHQLDWMFENDASVALSRQDRVQFAAIYETIAQ